MEPQVLIWRRTAIVLLGVVALLAWPTVRRLREAPPPPPPSVRLTFPAPPGTALGSGADGLDAAIAPGEDAVVFVATADGVTALWQRRLDSDAATALAGTAGATLPTWSPAGDRIAFFADQRLKAITLADGRVQDLAEAESPGGAAWLADGSLVFAGDTDGPLRRWQPGPATAPPSAASASALQPGDVRHVFPSVAGPAALVYVAVRDDGRRVIRYAAAGQTRDIGTTTGHAVVVGDFLLSVRDDSLLVQRFDREMGTVTGRAAPLALNVGASPSGHGLMAASPSLVLASAAGPAASRLTWFDTDGRVEGSVGEPGDYLQVRLSPDDRFVAVTERDPLLRTLDVSVLPTGPAGHPAKISRSLAADTDPVWSPDGGRVLFRSLSGGRADLFVRTAHDPEAPIEPMLQSPMAETPLDWSVTAGGQVLMTAAADDTGLDVWLFDARPLQPRQPQPLLHSGFNESDARWSPDGRWVAYVSDEPGSQDVYLRHLPDGAVTRVSRAGGTRPRWARDSSALYFLRGAQIMRSPRQDGLDPPFGTAVPIAAAPGLADFDTAHRGDRLLAVVPVAGLARPEVRAILDWQTTAQILTAPARPDARSRRQTTTGGQ